MPEQVRYRGNGGARGSNGCLRCAGRGEGRRPHQEESDNGWAEEGDYGVSPSADAGNSWLMIMRYLSGSLFVRCRTFIMPALRG